MRVCVTGGAGFIGSHLVERLLSRGRPVTVVDNFCHSYDARLKRANLTGLEGHPLLSLVEGDVLDHRVMDVALDDATAVVHLAALGGVRASMERPDAYWSANVGGTLSALQACLRRGVGRLVFASSSSVYGDRPPGPTPEEAGFGVPASFYAATKQASEGLCGSFNLAHGLDVTSLRLFSVYGPRQRPDLVMTRFTHRLLAGEALPVYGDTASSRDYTHVDDVVDGVMAALDGPDGHHVFNIGSGRPVTLADVVALLERQVGRAARLDRRHPQPGDVAHTWADLSLARQALGYRPQVPLEQGVASLVRWIEEADR